MSVFDKNAENYDKWYTTILGKHVDETETLCVFDLLKPEPGMKILDAGCGTGNFSIKLAKMRCEVTGIDISEKMLAIARKKALEENLKANFYSMDVCSLEFDDGTFDAVISVTAFEFMGKPVEAMNEMFRVLKRNGILLLGTINRNSKWGELYLKKGVKKDDLFHHVHLKTLEELKELRPHQFIGSDECLFVPPDANEGEISAQKEREFSDPGRGGFICALWRK